MLTAAASVAAEPLAYSVNSDSSSTTGTQDSVFRIDLANGNATRIAQVRSGLEPRIDVEGLAFSPDGTLYGVDDDKRTLFPINPDNGLVQTANEVLIKGLPTGVINDFGMTFTCDGTLYVTSVGTKSLYRMDLAGNTTRIGSEGSLGVNISGLAAFGNPTELYGLGNGANGNGATETPNLYRIDVTTGATSLVGPLMAAGPYLEGGLAFDDAGQLWAITEGALLGWDSQVMKIDKTTGEASAVRTLSENGFESLAITVPRGCQTNNNAELAQFTVQKQYVDGNDVTPVTLNIRCQTGLPLEQSFTVIPNPGPLGASEVEFTVDAFEDGALDCEVFETAPGHYTPSYECFSEGGCAASTSSCSFTDVSGGEENLCVIRNYPDPVEIVVATDWVTFGEGTVDGAFIDVVLSCRNIHDGDGERSGDTMTWSWRLDNGSDPVSATVVPLFDGGTECRTEVSSPDSALELASDCADWTPVGLSDVTRTCTIASTIFFEGIPTLNPLGLALATLLLLGTGLIAVRRF